MSSQINVRMGYEPERSAAFGAVTAGYVLMGALFTHPIKNIVFQNATNAAVSFSLDGVNTYITLQPGVYFTLDISTNFNQEFGAAPINWGVYIKYTTGAPTSGSVYASAMCGVGFNFAS